MKMRVLIVDDEHLARERLRELLDGHGRVEIAGEAGTGPDAVRAIEKLQPDLVFLDISLPAMNGFEVLSCVELPTLPLVVFTTAYDQYAIRAFEVQAIDYLLKPVEKEQLAESLRRARQRMTEREHDGSSRKLRELAGGWPRALPRIAVRDGERIVFVRPEEVDVVLAVGNYVRLQVRNEKFLLRNTMAAIAERLRPYGFVRIQRSVLINLERVAELRREAHDAQVVVLTTGGRYRVSPSYRAELEGAFSGV